LNSNRQLDPRELRMLSAWRPETFVSSGTEIRSSDLDLLARIDGFVPLTDGAMVACDHLPPQKTMDGGETMLGGSVVSGSMLNLSQGKATLVYFVEA
jgi:hypothetical protein